MWREALKRKEVDNKRKLKAKLRKKKTTLVIIGSLPVKFKKLLTKKIGQEWFLDGNKRYE